MLDVVFALGGMAVFFLCVFNATVLWALYARR